ncbi:phospholipase D/nuclease [Colletotrichum falcatum]|nr:phospholipase D/nuclease [Colletotrichum falcatum]
MSSPGQSGLPKLGNVLYQTVFQFPYSAYSVPRVPDQKTTSSFSNPPAISHAQTKSEYENAPTLSEPLVSFCASSNTVSRFLAEEPSLTPGQAWKKLANHYKSNSHEPKDIRDIGRGKVTNDELDVAFKCGKWGTTRPSSLFLRLYHDTLCTLNDNPAYGMASPSLLGSSGVVPLTILSVIPDIVRHMSNLIVRAEKEVILATNFWQNGAASKYITNAIKEASRRAGERGIRITMKVLYDRGSPKQLFEPHYIVPEKEYTGKAVGLPSKQEIPNVDLEVMNYHDPMLGTFHSKFMVVDRKIGVVQSNNIQDNDNLELMVHVEGPIVDSLYDMALLTWHKKLDPPLPTIETPAALGELGSFGLNDNSIFTAEGTLNGHRVILDPARMPQRASSYGPGAGQILPPVKVNDFNRSTTARPPPQDFQSGQAGLQTTPVAEFIANRSLPEHTHEDPHYDNDIAAEIARVQASISAKPNESQMQAVSRHLNHTINKDFKGTAPECDPAEEMTPYIPYHSHEPFPIALVNRPPYGPPNHKSVGNPQNAAWLSALRNAEKNVFIQTPTMNAEPLIPAILEACERGLDVFAYVCLGYNDAGELLPMQGGHSEMVAAHMYKKLSPSARKHLHYFWYVSKDQIHLIIAEKKKRSCHVKLMIVDESIAIVGSGNQDTQSWFHSQEVNIMLESRDLCKAWIDGLRRNQNTHRYGALNREDGVWRGEDGKEADGAMGVDPGRFSWAKGLLGAIKRLEGTGGF